MKLARVVFYVLADVDHWLPVPPAEVPDWLKDPETIGRMLSGEEVQYREGPWYRAEKLDDSSLFIPHAPNLIHKDEALQKVQ